MPQGGPFRPTAFDPPTMPNEPPGIAQVQSSDPWPFPALSGNPYPPTQQPYNTPAVLSPIFAVVVPPAGVVLGHWALVQIRRSGENGRTAAIWGLVIGYLLTAVLLIAVMLWAAMIRSERLQVMPATGDTVTAESPPPPVVVTSVAPVPNKLRVRLDLAQVAIGTCAEIQKRDIGDDALDLFGVPCEHRQGVYSVVARVGDDSDCRSTYVAAPPDHSFALCLNEF